MKTIYLALGLLVIFGMGAFMALRNNDSESVEQLGTKSSLLSITSPSFDMNGLIPSMFTCDVSNPVSPELVFANIPENTVSLALLVDDPDAPTPSGVFDHWVLFNIPAETKSLPEGLTLGVSGLNGKKMTGYVPPCPPPDHEPTEHRYFFKLYALDTVLNLGNDASKEDVEKALDAHVLDKGELVGRYKRVTTGTAH